MVVLVTYNRFKSFEDLHATIWWLIKVCYKKDKMAHEYMCLDKGPLKVCPRIRSKHNFCKNNKRGCAGGQLKFITFDVEEHKSLEHYKQYSNMYLLKSWFLNALSRMKYLGILKYKPFSGKKMLIGFPNEELTLENVFKQLKN